MSNDIRLGTFTIYSILRTFAFLTEKGERNAHYFWTEPGIGQMHASSRPTHRGEDVFTVAPSDVLTGERFDRLKCVNLTWRIYRNFFGNAGDLAL